MFKQTHFILIGIALVGALWVSAAPSLAQDKVAEQATKMQFRTRVAFPGSFGTGEGQQQSQTTLDGVFGKVISLMLRLLATLGIVVCIFGSWRMMTAMGNSGNLKKGQEAFMNAIIGIVIVLLSYVIVALVRDIILQVK